MAPVPTPGRPVVAAAGRLAAAVLLGVGVCAGVQAEPSTAVTAVRFWSLGEVTRIAVESTGELQYRSERLQDPERLFFDLLGAKPRLGGRNAQTIPVGDKLLRQIRVAETRPGITRIVLDLEKAVEFTAAQLANPNRLLIELRAPSGTAPARASEARTKPQESQKPVAAVQGMPLAETRAAATPPVSRPASPAASPGPSEESQARAGQAAAGGREEARSPAGGTAQAPRPATAKSTAKTTNEAPSLPESAPPAPAQRNQGGGRSLIRALGLKVGRVVIDPGHGGHDTGTISPSGLTEKDLVLDVAKRLGVMIEENLGAEVVYTRTDDSFVALEERTRVANESEADLFLSIHANSSSLRSVSGSETFYLNFTTSRAALDLAARENASSQKTIHELRDLIQKIALKDKIDESREFAASIQSALARGGTGSRNRGVKKAPFVVLIGASMPSVLTEVAFLSNAREEALLKREPQRQKLAEALFRGISKYASTLSHFQVAERKLP